MSDTKKYYKKSETYNKAEFNTLLENVLRKMKTYINQNIYSPGLEKEDRDDKADLARYSIPVCRNCGKPVDLERKNGKWMVWEKGSEVRHHSPGVNR